MTTEDSKQENTTNEYSSMKFSNVFHLSFCTNTVDDVLPSSTDSSGCMGLALSSSKTSSSSPLGITSCVNKIGPRRLINIAPKGAVRIIDSTDTFKT